MTTHMREREVIASEAKQSRRIEAERLLRRSAPRNDGSDLAPERQIVILGSTGSIGVNALGVAELLGERCQIVGLTAYGNTERLLDQVRRHSPEVVAVWEESTARDLRAKGIRVRGRPLTVLSGIDGLIQVATWAGANFVLS